MKIRIDTRQLDRLARDLSKAADKIEGAVPLLIAKTAADIEANAKKVVPVDTGFLKDSITSEADGLHAEVGPTASYGAYVEYGTARMAPQPYMGPAADARIPLLHKAIDKLIDGIL
jgi:HK97 gp10 family phage protein